MLIAVRLEDIVTRSVLPPDKYVFWALNIPILKEPFIICKSCFGGDTGHVYINNGLNAMRKDLESLCDTALFNFKVKSAYVKGTLSLATTIIKYILDANDEKSGFIKDPIISCGGEFGIGKDTVGTSLAYWAFQTSFYPSEGLLATKISNKLVSLGINKGCICQEVEEKLWPEVNKYTYTKQQVPYTEPSVQYRGNYIAPTAKALNNKTQMDFKVPCGGLAFCDNDLYETYLKSNKVELFFCKTIKDPYNPYDQNLQQQPQPFQQFQK